MGSLPSGLISFLSHILSIHKQKDQQISSKGIMIGIGNTKPWEQRVEPWIDEAERVLESSFAGHETVKFRISQKQ